MKKFILLLLSVISLSTLFAQNNGTAAFNYKKWQQEQEEKNRKESKGGVEENNTDNQISPTTLFLDGCVVAGKFRGAGASIGGFYRKINVEATYIYGLQESYQVERIYGDAHHYFTYRPSFWAVKSGYGISKFGSVRITPQIGIGVLQIKGKQANETISKGHDNSYITNLSAGIRLHYKFIKHFGITLVPEYRFVLHKSESFLDMTEPERGRVSEQSNTSDLKNRIKGFNCRFALTINLY